MESQHQDDKNESKPPLLSSQRSVQLTQELQDKRREDQVREIRADLREKANDLAIESLLKKANEASVKMGDFGEINEDNIDEFYRQRSQYISPDEIQGVIDIKVSRIIPLWEETIKELEKLEKDFLAKTPRLSEVDVTIKIAKNELEDYAKQVGLVSFIHTLIGGIGTSLANLKGNDAESKSLAVVSSRSRLDRLIQYLKDVSQLNLDLDLKKLQDLSEKLDSVIGVLYSLG